MCKVPYSNKEYISSVDHIFLSFNFKSYTNIYKNKERIKLVSENTYYDFAKMFTIMRYLCCQNTYLDASKECRSYVISCRIVFTIFSMEEAWVEK